MLKERVCTSSDQEISGSTHISSVKMYETPAGPLLLRRGCSSSLVGGLDSWWQGIGKAYEIAVEVSSRWRKLGIAHQLLSCALKFESLEEFLVLGLGFSWHWDYEGLGISSFRYREMIERLFATYGFVEYLTSEPNIRMDPANILLVRLGSKVEQGQVNQFFQRLLQSETLPGL